RAQIEGYRVVQERLPEEQRQAQQAASRVGAERDPGYLGHADGPSLPNGDALLWGGEFRTGLLGDRAFDTGDGVLGFLVTSVDERPPGAFRHVAAHQQYGKSEHHADQE